MRRRARDDLKILLLQIRDDPGVRREEYESFLRYAGLSAPQLDVLNVFDRPRFGIGVVSGYDALFVGGASEASVLEPETYPFVHDAGALLLHCIDRDIPVFASCFGFQLAVLALGGEVLRDGEDYEMGTLPIRLTEAARTDPVYRGMPDGFLAVSVHREMSPAPPPGCTELAYTDHCCHSFKVDGARFWAFQFHPEVDRRILVERLTVYRRRYTRDAAHLEQVLAFARETPEANALPARFVERVLLSNG